MIRMIAAIGLLAALGACNTVEGVGRDIAAGGTVLEDAANNARKPSPTATINVY